MRRTGKQLRPGDSKLYKQVSSRIDLICTDFEMRYSTSGLPSSFFYEQCAAMVNHHFETLHSLVEIWPRVDVVDYICTTLLKLCSGLEVGDGIVNTRTSLR